MYPQRSCHCLSLIFCDLGLALDLAEVRSSVLIIVYEVFISTHIGKNTPNRPNTPKNAAEDRQTLEAEDDGALVDDGLNVILLLLGGTVDGGETISSSVEGILGGDDIVGFALVGVGLGTLYSDGVLFCKQEAPNIVE